MKSKRPLHLLIQNGTIKSVYTIDDYKSLSIQWNNLTSRFLISFKQFGKEHLISTTHFHITGRVYCEV